jgi:hypothetical protein
MAINGGLNERITDSGLGGVCFEAAAIKADHGGAKIVVFPGQLF